MSEDPGKDDKFDLSPELEGYISLDEARVLALQHARDNREVYGLYAEAELVFEVVDAGETLDFYEVTLSYLPPGNFQAPGTERITIVGQTSLKPFDHDVVADRIEFGTFLVAGAMIGDDLTLKGGVVEHQTALIDKLIQAGTEVFIDNDHNQIHVSRPEKLSPVNIKTAPYPGFPTDMQAQFVLFNAVANGSSTVTETVFENRFMHVHELQRMGADIHLRGNTAVIHGVTCLSGAQVMATDLRASACLVLAGLVAEGETMIDRIYHIDRGYDRIEEKLSQCGASIRRIPGWPTTSVIPSRDGASASPLQS